MFNKKKQKKYFQKLSGPLIRLTLLVFLTHGNMNWKHGENGDLDGMCSSDSVLLLTWSSRVLDCEVRVGFKSDSECLSNTSCKAKKSIVTTKRKLILDTWVRNTDYYLHLGRQGQSAHVHWETSLADLYQLVEAQSLSEILLGRVGLSLLLGLQRRGP